MPQSFVPYTSSMRMLCVEGVGCRDDDQHTVEKSLNSVTYSSRVIEKISDIATAMDISLSHTMIQGSLNHDGSGTFIDEEKIIAADVNVLVSVKVMSRSFTTSAPSDFQTIHDFDPRMDVFHEAFGTLSSLALSKVATLSVLFPSAVLMAVTGTASYKRKNAWTLRQMRENDFYSIGEIAQTKTDPSDPNDTISSATKRYFNNSALRNTETTISGIGPPWDIDAVYQAAAAFPDLVANNPQYTWAILTKYNASRSWNERMCLPREPGSRFKDYCPVMRYTATLFDNFMKYKGLVAKVQDILSHGDQYTSTSKPNSIELDVTALVEVRAALQNEMDKIASVILSQVDSFAKTTENELVHRLLYATRSSSSRFKDLLGLHGDEPCRTPTGHSSDTSTADFQDILTPVTNDLDSVVNNEIYHKESTTPVPIHSFETKMKSLMAPELWEVLLPTRKPSLANQNQAKDDLKIIAAVCGFHDVKSALQALVVNGEMAIAMDAIKASVNGEIYKREMPLLGWNLSFIYQYGDGPTRICSSNYDEKSSGFINISKSSNHPISILGKYHIITAIYGGFLCSEDQIKSVEKELEHNHGCKYDIPHGYCIVFNNELIGANPWHGVTKTGVVFFTMSNDSRIYTEVGIENQCFHLQENYRTIIA
ncbi:hypothetical protein FCULG_00004500 [Fusarium culmorum]|uniref:Uncharacterized protein n=1 Tax=Fusarium culmorum TaxID=5516 RepID=A0A2T4H655_FUSCU|nr:hypothetical protein FCULG_00004500 [Fusarium culmorum]